ncbi:Casein kinase II regulatory subunit family protein [Trichomonas vaginalis G3]|uniref:Casein kinase II subunit beta n=1 Tax=Trichomonas vaginalis (strain ATCC PRA-98 / G3) TaxID=412133 RepID=A2DHL6_TRIV3|nr:protein kinase regulator protein [Trichomonas vaginalis G3]EAY20064.1 Casein kinase II regulatory subunit family protein [Trichomonas vaginalis G3]KAI5528016.1 protein kinase regulator protein [Trichomonas vaginalis G3]|eukprot:XP_001581050.1 Casein kinase II regulatory subunit family protein [Trichomonas vaginalis G3]
MNLQDSEISSWKKEFLDDPKNSWFCDVPDDFIKDKFNLWGLDTNPPPNLKNIISGISKSDYTHYFTICTNIITGQNSLASVTKSLQNNVLRVLPFVYGMIHARFVITPGGISQLSEKFSRHTFGVCPRINCEREPLLPIGSSSTPGESMVSGFCPCCRKVYTPRPVIEIDGAFFGPNAAHILVDHLKILNYHMNFRPFVREACGFKVYDEKQFKENRQ